MSINYASRAVPRLALGMAWMEYAYNQSDPEFVAGQILPIFRSAQQAAKFSALKREAFLSISEAKRAPRAGYGRVDGDSTDKEFSTDEYGLEGLVDDRERKIYRDDFDHEMATLRLVASKVMRAREKRVADTIFNTTTWTGSDLTTDVSGAAPWDTASSLVIANVVAAKRKVRLNSGSEPNALILSATQAENLLTNTEIKAQFPGALLITLEMLKASFPKIFGLDRLIVGRGVYNTADEGLAYSGAEIWSDDYAMIAKVVTSESAPLTEPGVGRTVIFEPDSSEELVVESYREEQSRGDVLRCRHDTDELILGAQFGHLLKID